MKLNRKLSWLVTLVCAVLVVSCASQEPKKSRTSASVPIPVDVKKLDRIYFTGRGAGAGVMLTSTMGPMGIAIGVAIDEGIGKDIQKAFTESGFQLSVFVAESAKQHCWSTHSTDVKIRLAKVQFRSMGDDIFVELIGEIEEQGQTRAIGNDTSSAPSHDLDQLKQDGHYVASAIDHQVQSLCANEASRR